jgi:hypothetical protein
VSAIADIAPEPIVNVSDVRGRRFYRDVDTLFAIAVLALVEAGQDVSQEDIAAARSVIVERLAVASSHHLDDELAELLGGGESLG